VTAAWWTLIGILAGAVITWYIASHFHQLTLRQAQRQDEDRPKRAVPAQKESQPTRGPTPAQPALEARRSSGLAAWQMPLAAFLMLSLAAVLVFGGRVLVTGAPGGPTGEGVSTAASTAVRVRVSGGLIGPTGFVSDGSVMVPARSVVEAADGLVHYNLETGRVFLTVGLSTTWVNIGCTTSYVNGYQVRVDPVPVAVGGTLYVPLSFCEALFAAHTGYDSTTNTAWIEGPGPWPYPASRDLTRELLCGLQPTVGPGDWESVVAYASRSPYSTDLESPYERFSPDGTSAALQTPWLALALWAQQGILDDDWPLDQSCIYEMIEFENAYGIEFFLWLDSEGTGSEYSAVLVQDGQVYYPSDAGGGWFRFSLAGIDPSGTVTLRVTPPHGKVLVFEWNLKEIR